VKPNQLFSYGERMGIFHKAVNYIRQKSTWRNTILERMGSRGFGSNDARIYSNDTDYLNAMARNTWVYAAVTAIADNFTRPKYWFERMDGKDSQTEVFIPELRQLLNAPTPYHTGSELFEATITNLLLTGKCFWYLSGMTALSMFQRDKDGNLALDAMGKPILKVPARPIAGGQPSEIWVLRPDCVKIIAGAPGELFKEFIYQPDHKTKYVIPPDAIIYFRRYDPMNVLEGLGVIEAARLVLETEQRAVDWNNTFFVNSATADMVLTTDQNLTTEQMERYRTQWYNQHGGQDRSRRTAFLGGGIKPTLVNVSQRDMDFLNQRRFSREEILAMFRVPPAKVGIFEQSKSYASVKEQDAIFWGECMEPHLRRFAEKLTSALVSRYRPDTAFVFEDMLPEDKQLQAEIANRFISCGAMSPNEARKIFNLGEPYPDGDRFYIATSLRPTDIPFPNVLAAKSASNTPPAVTGTEREQAAFPLTKGYTAAEEEIITRNMQRTTLKEFQEQERECTRNVLNNPRLLSLAGKEFRKALEDDVTTIVYQLTDWMEADVRYAQAMHEEFQVAVNVSGQRAMRDISAAVSFDVLNPAVVAWMEDYVPRLAGNVSLTTRKHIEATLLEGIQGGETMPKLRDRVRATFRQAKDFRAEMIARTETIRARGKGDLYAWQQSGMVEAKEWHTANDELVCPYCKEMKGRTQLLTENFFNLGDTFDVEGAGTMRLDYTAIDAPPLHPHCRCVLLPIIRKG